MPRDIDISLLRAFVAVIDTGSVTGASRLLNRTQAAVSLQVKRLEELLGVQLFERQHKRLTLAAAGERLLGNAQRLLSMNDDVWGQMTTPDFEGAVRFGVPADLITTYIPPILRRFNKAWPRVSVTLMPKNSAELLRDFEDGRIDVALTTDETVGRHGETLRRDRLVWVAAPDTDCHRADPLPVVLGCTTCRFRPLVVHALRKARRNWRSVIEISDYAAQNATVAAGLAVMASLRDSVPDGLDILGPDAGLPPLPELLIDLYLPAAGASAIAAELARHVRAEFATRFPAMPESTIVVPKRLPTRELPPRPARANRARMTVRSIAR